MIYLGIGLVKVIQSARNDDDWQQLARTPLILVVTVTMGDTVFRSQFEKLDLKPSTLLIRTFTRHEFFSGFR